MNRVIFKDWRPSASLILVGKTIFSKPDKYDYKLLCLQRSSKSSFMPNSYVFPGGNISNADCDIQWLKLFERCGLVSSFLKQLEPKTNKTIILDPVSDEIPRSVSLRITAIRETFEECGILLCRRKQTKSPNDLNCNGWASYIGGAEMKEWQNKVTKNPFEFLKLCEELDVYPDLFALNTWSNWMTPSIYKMRFNTMFFITVCSDLPPARVDATEIQELKVYLLHNVLTENEIQDSRWISPVEIDVDFQWKTPDDFIQLSNHDRIELPLPQIYEISKLRHFAKLETLLEFARGRSENGCEEYLPKRIKTPDGLFSILPGDDLYPGISDLLKTELDFVEKLPPSLKKNRVLQNREGNRIIVENFQPKASHIIPFAE